MSGLLIKMVMFLTFMTIGYLSVKKGIVSQNFAKDLSRLMLTVLMPASILNSILNSDISMSVSELGYALCVMISVQIIIILLAALAARLIRVEKDVRQDFELLMGYSNTLFITMPVMDSLFGAQAAFYCILSSIPFNAFAFTHGVIKLSRSGGGEKINIKDILSPPTVATVLAIVLLIFRIPVPEVFRELVGGLAGATLPISMIIIGSSMGGISLISAFKNKTLYIASFFKLIAAPAVTFALLGFFVKDPVLFMTAVIAAASPTATLLTSIALRSGEDGIFMSQGILQSTVLSLVTIPAIVFLMSMGG